MPSKIVYLHIPKSGGTSQRLSFYSVYGEENVYWHGIDSDPEDDSYNTSLLADATVIGGHRPISYYPVELDEEALFLSVVREPIARAVSLFSYFAKPEFAEGPWVGVRQRQYERWLDKGIQPDSLVKSLETCPSFRREVENVQCRYLSRYTSDLEGVRQTLDEVNAVVASHTHSADMNAYLSETLGWGGPREYQANRSLRKSNELILEERGAFEALNELLKEDLRLYEFIVAQHSGLLRNLKEEVGSYHTLTPKRQTSTVEQDERTWRHVHLYSKGYMGLQADGSSSLALVIVNQGVQNVAPKDYPAMALSYCALDGEGREIYASQSSRPLKALLKLPLNSHDHFSVSLDVQFPAPVAAQAAFVKIWLTIRPGLDVTQFNELHPASVAVIRVGCRDASD